MEDTWTKPTGRVEAREGGGFGWGQGGGVGRKCRQLQLNNKIIFKKELKKGILRMVFHTIKVIYHYALAGEAQWLSASLQIKGLLVGFPVRAHAWVAGQVPSWGCVRGNRTLMFLSLSFSLPSLSKE